MAVGIASLAKKKTQTFYEVQLGGKKTTKTMPEIRKLAAALEKTNNGVYAPHLPVVTASKDMPDAVLEERLPRINEVLVVNFANKIESRPLISNSDVV